MRYLIFGTGDYYSRYKKWFERCEILALLDNSEQKQHTFIDGIEVLAPKEGIRLKYDRIVILSFYVKVMKQQLISLGVDEACIYHFYDLHRLLAGHVDKRPIHYFLNARSIVESDNTKKQKIVLLSNDLTFGGPAIALFNAAKVLKEQGYTVVVASMIEGPLREILIHNNIPVIVDENLQRATMQETKWICAFSLIICNTLNYYVFLSERETAIPVIWWLHDARFFYDGVDRKVIGKINTENLNAVSVGAIPSKAVREFLPDLLCGELLYGVSDEFSASDYYRKQLEVSHKVRFITIGFLETRKGQDILLQAIKELPDHIRSNTEFYIVGYNETIFGESIRSESINMKEIFLIGSVGREQIHDLLNRSDILICPSRQDPMPTVAVEAMMHSVPCIVSDATGTAEYIHDGEEGFVVPSEDVRALAERIEWCVVNSGNLDKMGKKARRLYEEHFSIAVFERRFMEIIKKTLENDSR